MPIILTEHERSLILDAVVGRIMELRWMRTLIHTLEAERRAYLLEERMLNDLRDKLEPRLENAA